MRLLAWAPLLALLLPLALPTASSADEQPAAGPCVGNLDARANGDGSVTLDWSPVAGASAYVVHRATGNGPFSERVRVDAPATSFRDASTEAGVRYRYVVLQEGAGASAAACASVPVTAVPYVPGLLRALGIAAVGLLGYALVVGTRRAPVSRR